MVAGIKSESPAGLNRNSQPRVREILSWYGADSAGTLTNLARLLNHGRLAGTGKLVILPVDQGFEHGPARSFAPNPPAYNPHYHFELAIEAGCNAYAARLPAQWSPLPPRALPQRVFQLGSLRYAAGKRTNFAGPDIPPQRPVAVNPAPPFPTLPSGMNRTLQYHRPSCGPPKTL